MLLLFMCLYLPCQFKIRVKCVELFLLSIRKTFSLSSIVFSFLEELLLQIGSGDALILVPLILIFTYKSIIPFCYFKLQSLTKEVVDCVCIEVCRCVSE